VATARERTAGATRVYEQIPHPGVPYAYLALEAGNVNEFAKLKADAIADDSLAHYRSALMGQQASAKEAPKPTPRLTAAQKAKLVGKEEESSPVQQVDGDEEGEQAIEAGSDTSTDAADAPVAPDSPAQSEESAEETPKERARRIARERLMARKAG
jgi:hypothetical protein